jgi:4'-phosphopantetheinyl transferase
VTVPQGGGREILPGLHLAWARAEALPAGEAWLTPAEREVLGDLRVEKRRADWLLGRWAAKQAVRALLGRSLPHLEILADEGGRPVARLGSGSESGPARDGPMALSISHSAGMGFAAAGLGTAGLGCDLETIETRSDAFVADYFTDGERAAVVAAPPERRALLANLLWSAKESALKALGEGLRLDTRTVPVDTGILQLDATSWSPLRVTGPGARVFDGWWRAREGMVWTVVREVPPAAAP